LNALTFQNKTGQSAKFLWQEDILYNKDKTRYFEEINNDLGVKVSHYEGFITVTHGGGRTIFRRRAETMIQCICFFRNALFIKKKSDL